ncbi:unnamed protein product [Mycena citricolor]|nr:unnamed protein product [Mycena citricolor]
MFNLIIARRNTLLAWASIEAGFAIYVWNAYRTPSATMISASRTRAGLKA